LADHQNKQAMTQMDETAHCGCFYILRSFVEMVLLHSGFGYCQSVEDQLFDYFNLKEDSCNFLNGVGAANG